MNNLIIKARKLIVMSYMLLTISAVSFVLGFWFWTNLIMWFGIAIVSGLAAKCTVQIAEDLLDQHRS